MTSVFADTSFLDDSNDQCIFEAHDPDDPDPDEGAAADDSRVAQSSWLAK